MRPAAAVFPLLAVLWIAPRLVPGGSTVPQPLRAQIEGLSVLPSPDTGRYEIRGLAGVGPGGVDLFGLPGNRAARQRFEGEIAESNDRLARLAEQVGGRIELFPEEGVTAIRLSGLVVPFYEQDADRLARARGTARERPHEALETVAAVLDARLSEAPDPFGLEETTRRRDMTRLLREIRDELAQVEARNEQALARLREEVLAAAGDAEGPFRRRGPLRMLEILLAALLAATLREAIRREPPVIAPAVSLSFAPLLAVCGVLALEAAGVLPVDPIGGTHVAFVPIAFALGFCAAGVLEVVSRLDRRERPALREAVAAVGPPRVVAPAALPEPSLEPRPAEPVIAPAASPEPATPPQSEREIDEAEPPPPRRIELLPFQRRERRR